MSVHRVYDNPAAYARSRCVWWLSGQCTGGHTCQCAPTSTEVPGDQDANDDGNPTPDAHQPWADADNV